MVLVLDVRLHNQSARVGKCAISTPGALVPPNLILDVKDVSMTLGRFRLRHVALRVTKWVNQKANATRKTSKPTLP